MIINTGLRTDIPAFYAPWFINRIKDGFVYVRNPYNEKQVTKYILNSQLVDLFVFCSKNPRPLIDLLQKDDVLKDYGQYWFVTITPYSTDVEPFVPEIQNVIETYKILAKRLGKNCVCWRYDPIFLSSKYNVEFHLNAFEHIAKQLEGFADVCVISFIDLYKKVQRNFSEISEVSVNEQDFLCRAFLQIGQKYGISIKTCAEDSRFASFGVDVTGCMTKDVFEKALNQKLQIPKFKQNRKECACLLTADIGAYNTCGHFCRYCYANNNKRLVKQNISLHDPFSPFLTGTLQKNDEIKDAKQVSFKIAQKEFWQNI